MDKCARRMAAPFAFASSLSRQRMRLVRMIRESAHPSVVPAQTWAGKDGGRAGGLVGEATGGIDGGGGLGRG